MKKNIQICFVFVFLLKFSLGCVYLEDSLNHLNKIKPNRDDTLEIRKKAILALKPEFAKDEEKLLVAAQLAAGPFTIQNITVNYVTSKPDYDHKKQGADWPNLFSTCAENRQSPINIITRDAVKTFYRGLVFRNYADIHPNMEIVNNGHTVDISGPWGENGLSLPQMSGGPLDGSYRLYSAHFHWGYNESQGSEHIIDNSPGALEMHFVHFNTKYISMTEALNADDPESLAVVGIIFKPFWRTTLTSRGIFNTLRTALTGQIVYPAYFPLSIINQGQYYTYQGSLTIPPCTEKVRWIVMRKPLTVGFGNLEMFKKWLENGEPIEGTYRLPQKLNGRIINRS